MTQFERARMSDNDVHSAAATSQRLALQQKRKDELFEQWVRVMELRIVREKLKECYLTEGVNRYYSCRALAERVRDMTATHRLKGSRNLYMQ